MLDFTIPAVEEVREVEIMAPYVAFHYLPFMLIAKDAARSLSALLWEVKIRYLTYTCQNLHLTST